MIRLRTGSPYWYAVFRENRKLRWYSTKQTQKTLALAIHDGIRERIKKERTQKYIAIALGQRPKISKALLIRDAWGKYASLNPRYSLTGMKVFEAFARWTDSNRDIAEIDTNNALDFLRKFDISGKTYNNYKSSLSKIWRTLKPFSDITANPWAEIPNQPTDSEHFRPITSDEYKTILNNTSGFWHDAVIISYYSGLRKKDIRILEWSKIHADAIETIPAKTSANNKNVYIPLHSEIKKVLAKIPKKGKHLFPEFARHDRKNEDYFQNLLEKLNIKAVPPMKVGFHSLRVSFITRCEESGILRHVIQGIVGHGSPAMTERYSHDRESAKAILKLK